MVEDDPGDPSIRKSNPGPSWLRNWLCSVYLRDRRPVDALRMVKLP